MFEIILGFIQGITEFVPVSSSGHLIVVREWLGVALEGSLAFDVMLHLATALAVIVYFHKDLFGVLRTIRTNRMLLYALIIGSIPAAILGLLFEDVIEVVFRDANSVAWALIVGSIVFIVAEKVSKKMHGGELTVKNAFIIGLFQTLALIPGFSRSGSTISGGLILGLDREQTTRFAFLLSLPVLLGAGALKLFDLMQGEGGMVAIGGVVTGSMVAFIVGLGAIHGMIRFLKTHTLYVFVWYRVILAILILVLL